MLYPLKSLPPVFSNKFQWFQKSDKKQKKTLCSFSYLSPSILSVSPLPFYNFPSFPSPFSTFSLPLFSLSSSFSLSLPFFPLFFALFLISPSFQNFPPNFPRVGDLPTSSYATAEKGVCPPYFCKDRASDCVGTKVLLLVFLKCVCASFWIFLDLALITFYCMRWFYYLCVGGGGCVGVVWEVGVCVCDCVCGGGGAPVIAHFQGHLCVFYNTTGDSLQPGTSPPWSHWGK